MVLGGCSKLTGEDPQQWRRSTTLIPGDGDNGDLFGTSVSMSSDGATAIIGARNEAEPNGEQSGAIYVVDRSGSKWEQRTKLAPANGDTGDEFGSTTGLSGDGRTAIVGAPSDEDVTGELAGTSYVFSTAQGEWSQQEELTGSDVASPDQFGFSVELSHDGSVALIGAPFHKLSNGQRSGAAYVFVRAGGNWTQKTKLSLPDGTQNDAFGSSISIDENSMTALVGAPGRDNSASESTGTVEVFENTDGRWTRQDTLSADDGVTEVGFGQSTALSADGTIAVVGAPQEKDSRGKVTGTAYLFERSGDRWTRQAKLVPSNGINMGQFGRSIAILDSEPILFIGAPGEVVESNLGAGLVHVFERVDGAWTKQAQLTTTNPQTDESFGSSIAVSQRPTAIVGAPSLRNQESEMTGGACIIDR